MNRWDNGNHSWWKHDSVVLILLQDGVRRSPKTHRTEGSGGDKSVREAAWIAKAEKERDELRERLWSYSEQHKAENREVVHHTIKKGRDLGEEDVYDKIEERDVENLALPYC